MSVPSEQIAPGRYYRTSIGGKPTVVRVDSRWSDDEWLCQNRRTGRTVRLKHTRLFTEVVAAGDGSGRWVEFDRAKAEAKLTAALWRQDARP